MFCRCHIIGGALVWTYGEVLGDVVLDETDISGVSRAFSLLVSLVLVTLTGGKERSGGEARSGREGGSESHKGDEEKDYFGEHVR